MFRRKKSNQNFIPDKISNLLKIENNNEISIFMLQFLWRDSSSDK